MIISRRQALALGIPAAMIMSGCTGWSGGPVEPAGPLPTDQLVFLLTGAPGFAPAIYWALAAPTLAVYGDGRVIMADDEWGDGSVPGRYSTALVDPMAVARFAVRAEGSGLISDTTDLGTPQVTDLGTTAVTLHGERAENTVSAYAFSEQFDDGLTRRQRSNRRQLRELIASAWSLTSEAATSAYVPDRVVVLELQTRSGSPSALTTWPGPDPDTFLRPGKSGGRQAMACGELTGAVANTVYLAAQKNPKQQWLVGSTTRVLAVNALPIGLAC